MSDVLQRFVFEGHPVRGELVVLEQSWQTVLDRHQYPPEVRQVLGELLAAAVLLAATLKMDGALVLQLHGRGPLRLAVVECVSGMQIRATAKWQGDVSGMGLRELAGQGQFSILLDPKSGAQAYQGVVALEGDTVAQVLQHYMHRSEQLETSLWLAADQNRVAGMLLQKLPGADSDPDTWNRVNHLAATLRPQELLSLEPRDMLHRLFHEETLRLFQDETVEFHCACSRDKVAGVLRMLGAEEVASILEEQDEVAMTCEFCHQVYRFDAVDAAQLFASSEPMPPPAGNTRH